MGVNPVRVLTLLLAMLLAVTGGLTEKAITHISLVQRGFYSQRRFSKGFYQSLL